MRLVGYILLVLIGTVIGSYWPATPYLPPKETVLETVRDNVPFLADWLPEADEAEAPEAVEESTEVLEESAETASEAVEETIESAEETAEYVVVGAATEAAEETVEEVVDQPPITSATDETPDMATSVADNANLRTNQAAINIIKEREGLKLEAYTGPGGQLLIGYGHSADVTQGMTITAEQAETLLRDDLVITEQDIKKRLKVPVNENELSAMVLLAYNIGTGAFGSSSVLNELNGGNKAAAADSFLLWNKVRRDGELVEDSRLTEHREEERELFLK